ncbi:MAG: hypothetical protein AABY15_09115 [Nanoarchaeota archaeon]
MVKKSKGNAKRAQRISQPVSRSTGQTNIDKALIENFVSTQRVMVNLSGKLDNLANQISKLLELFEISAKALAEKNFQIAGDRMSEKVAGKIDTLLDQNKIIARGLMLVHELNAKQEAPREYPSGPRPIANEGIEGYQKSIGSEENTSNFESPVPSEDKKFRKLPRG